DGAGAPSELTWRKNIALVVYLARSPKRARAREHLIGLLWGDKPDEKARHSLNEAVRVLRRYAGEGGVDSDAAQVRFHADAVELEPLSDAAVRAVMRCHALAGDRAGALEQGEIFARRLKAEVGTEPELETRALAERMRHERMWRLPQRVGGAAAETRRAPLVGRAAELERLVESWAAGRRERRATVAVIEGDAGLGKTRLAGGLG